MERRECVPLQSLQMGCFSSAHEPGAHCVQLPVGNRTAQHGPRLEQSTSNY
jgi:hypothetical protein